MVALEYNMQEEEDPSVMMTVSAFVSILCVFGSIHHSNERVENNIQS